MEELAAGVAAGAAVAVEAGAAAVVVVALPALFVAMDVAEAVVLATPLLAVTFVAPSAPSPNPRFGIAKKTTRARAVEYKKRLCLPNLLRRKVGQDRFVRRFLKIRIILTPLSSFG